MPIFTTATDADGIATITWDLPGKSMNVLTEEGIAELDAAVDAALADPAVKGLVITSAKPDFAAGMDLNVLAGMKDRAGADPGPRPLRRHHGACTACSGRSSAPAWTRRPSRAASPSPAPSPASPPASAPRSRLACHRRFMADNPKARIGLPEILIGIFPGAGGTTRLVRMLGPMAAAPLLLEGKMLAPAAAKAAGLIDEVVPPDDLLATAKAWVKAAQPADIVKPWDAKGYKLPGGAPYHPAGFMTFVGASAMVHGKTQGAYPAAQAMLSAIYEGALVDFDTALRIEARWFTRVAAEPLLRGDDPHPLPQQAGAGEGRRPPRPPRRDR